MMVTLINTLFDLLPKVWPLSIPWVCIRSLWLGQSELGPMSQAVMVLVLHYCITNSSKTYRLKKNQTFIISQLLQVRNPGVVQLWLMPLPSTIEVSMGAADSSRLDWGGDHFRAHSCGYRQPVPRHVGLCTGQLTTRPPAAIRVGRRE